MALVLFLGTALYLGGAYVFWIMHSWLGVAAVGVSYAVMLVQAAKGASRP
ncbi:MAG TPA: hypothetical protein VGG68_15015 [Caulobacteraceae bacterium]|jgi:hypothetical protein